MTSIIHENIENLTSLWQKVGEKAGAYHSEPAYDFCALNYSDWPNRLWFHDEVTGDSLRAAKNELRATPTKLVIPYFDVYQPPADDLFAAQGFEKLSEQVGMSLQITQPYEVTETVSLERVSTRAMALLWETVFRQAFGYKISHELLLPDYEDIRFLLAFHTGKPIGTVLLHNFPKTIMGIHSMGIIPEMRGKGFAEQMMRAILNQAVEQGFERATLQASSMGKGLYLKLDFEQQFVMSNYGLPLVA